MTITINGSGTIGGLSAGGLPDATIQQADLATNVAGTGPAFAAAQSVAQTFTTAVVAKQTMPTEFFDTNSNYNNTGSTVNGVPAYAFLPTVAGYYQINFGVGFQNYSNTSTGEIIALLYKNGSLAIYGSNMASGSIPHWVLSSGSCLIYMNGTTDYLELYGYQQIGANLNTVGNSNWNFFNGFLARAA
jgi:hypothetical protein